MGIKHAGREQHMVNPFFLIKQTNVGLFNGDIL